MTNNQKDSSSIGHWAWGFMLTIDVTIIGYIITKII